MLLSEWIRAAQEEFEKYGDAEMMLRLLVEAKPIARIALRESDFVTVIDTIGDEAHLTEYTIDIPVTTRLKEIMRR